MIAQLEKGGTTAVSKTEAVIERAIAHLIPKDTVAELRILGAGRGVISGYYDDPKAFARDAALWSGIAKGVYWTVNPCNQALLLRSPNLLREYVPRGGTTSDTDIERLRYMPIDIDPVRPAGVSATHEEHLEALGLQGRVVDFLHSLGYSEPLEIDSGNGAYVLVPIDLPNTEASTELVRRCLNALAARLNTDKARVDVSTYNPSRILRVPGTMNCKGSHTQERPHRRAILTLVPGVEL